MAVKGAKGKAKKAKAKEELYRQLILDAAQGVFADNGYDDAKIGQIAEASGVSLQTLYSVFPGKAANLPGDLRSAARDTRRPARNHPVFSRATQLPEVATARRLHLGSRARRRREPGAHRSMARGARTAARGLPALDHPKLSRQPKTQ